MESQGARAERSDARDCKIDLTDFDGRTFDLTAGQPDHFWIRIWIGNDVNVGPIYSYRGDLAGGNVVVHKN